MQQDTPRNNVGSTTIYLFDSLINQEITHIYKLHNAINQVISNAKNSDRKTITIYVDCPDTVIDERFQPTLNALHNAVQDGITLDISNVGKKDSMYVRVLESIIEVAKIPTPADNPFRKYTKQH